MKKLNENLRRIDPIFHLKTPLLFAHRGGALETAESTEKGFRHAIEKAGADVLELDVQLTRDGKFVVWHGPKLDNVRIEGEDDNPSNREGRKIYHFDWSELDGKAWVADPTNEDELNDLSKVPQDEDRCLLLLSDFLGKFKENPLNIEMKKSFKRKINETNRRGLKDNIKAFTNILDSDPGKAERKIVVVSAKDSYIDEFREINGEKYPTGLSIKEQLIFQLKGMDLTNRALETSYDENFSHRNTVDRAKNSGGATFVFLTGFGPFWPSIDDDPREKEIFKILDRGVDGIMTDRPKRLREIMDKWLERA